MNLIDGRKLAQDILQDVANTLNTLSYKPKLAIILASEDESSKIYVNLKMKEADRIGIASELINFNENSSSLDIINRIHELNRDSSVHGIMVQLPLFSKFEPQRGEIINAISPLKDADGLTAVNLGLISQLVPSAILPATVDAVLECIKNAFSISIKEDFRELKSKFGQGLAGKNILIINNTNLIGKPLAMILSSLYATVTIANKTTKNLISLSQNADIIITATGVTNLLDATMIKPGAILIDVTSVKTIDGVRGDFIISEDLKTKASFYTPVPGGVGPLTIACLLRNLVKASIFQEKKHGGIQAQQN